MTSTGHSMSSLGSRVEGFRVERFGGRRGSGFRV